MKHLTRDEMLEAIEQRADGRKTGGQAAFAHLDECQVCRREVDELAALLGETGSLAVPEPSPLFWEQFSRRVSKAVEEHGEKAGAVPEDVAFGGWRTVWGRWRLAAAAFGTAAVVLLVVAATLGRGPGGAPAPGPSAETGTPATAQGGVATGAPGAEAEGGDEESWVLLSDLVAEAQDENESVLLPAAPGSAEQAVLHMSDEERVELGRLLQAEIDRERARLAG